MLMLVCATDASQPGGLPFAEVPGEGRGAKRQGVCGCPSLCLYLPSGASGHPSTPACLCLFAVPIGWLAASADVLVILSSLCVCFSLPIWLIIVNGFLSISMSQIDKPLSVGFHLHTHWFHVSFLTTHSSSEPGSLHSGGSRFPGLADPTQCSCGHEDACFPGGCCHRCTASAWSTWPGAWEGHSLPWGPSVILFTNDGWLQAALTNASSLYPHNNTESVLETFLFCI